MDAFFVGQSIMIGYHLCAYFYDQFFSHNAFFLSY